MPVPVILKEDSSFEKAVEVFRAGGVIAYPTETFYGLCVDPFNQQAVERLFALKGRAETNPVALIIAGRSMLSAVTSDVPPQTEKLIDKFWPGPLTIIFKAIPKLPERLLAGTGKAGVRISSHPAAIRLSEAVASPITATSANPSGQPPASSAEEVLKYFDGKIDLLIEGGKLAGKKGSTMVDVTGPEPVIVREGEIAAKEVWGCLGL